MLYMVLGLAAFHLVTLGLGALNPWPDDYGLRQRFEFFAAHCHTYDAVIVGSSNLYRSLVPEVIERAMARKGVEMRIFNLATPAMISYETDHLLKEILALKPARLKWVIIEPSDFDPIIIQRQDFTRRIVQWHSFEETCLAILGSWKMEAQLIDRLHLIWRHFVHWAWKRSCYGCGPELVRALFDLGPLEEELNDFEANGGYRPLEEEEREEYKKRQADFKRQRKQYRARVDTMEQKASRTITREAFNLRALRRQVEIIRAQGAEPIYVMGPVLESMPLLDDLLERGEIPTLMRYNRPSVYPYLYEEKLRFDKNHLTREGAVLFSHLFCRDLARHLQKGEAR